MLKGNIHHSVAFWPFAKGTSPHPWTLEEMCQVAVSLGIKSVELIEPEFWPILRKHGLQCAIALNAIPVMFNMGFNDEKYHKIEIEKTKQRIDLCAANPDICKQVIAFTGFDIDDSDAARELGIKNCIKGLSQIASYAEKKNVIISLEMLNTRDTSHPMKGHFGYQGNHIDEVAHIIKTVGSPNIGLLFDIYHVQIMDGDIIRRIQEYSDIITHYHTAGNPGRAELDNTQEINYPGVMRAIVETGYKGFVGHEFIPTHDPKSSLRQAVTLCDV